MLLLLLLVLRGLSEERWPLFDARKSFLEVGSWVPAPEQEVKYKPIERTDLPLCGSGFENFDGEWVYDEEVKLRYGTSNEDGHCVDCIARHYKKSAADLLSRVMEAVKWKWQPRKCRYLHLYRRDFVKLMAGKRLLLIGDSVMGQVWRSLRMILEGNTTDPFINQECERLVAQMKEECMDWDEMSGVPQSKVCDSLLMDCKTNMFIVSNKENTSFVHVDFVRTWFLGARSWIHDYVLGDNQKRLSLFWSSISKEKKYDVVLFETGVHWTNTNTDKIFIYSGLSISSILMKLSYRTSEIFSDVFAGSIFIYMPIWQPNRQCDHAVEPLKFMIEYWKNSSLWDGHNFMYLPDINNIIVNAWEIRNKLLYTLDTTVLSLNPLGRVGFKKVGIAKDCVHALTPGVYDVIGDWLLTLLVSISEGSRKV